MFIALSVVWLTVTDASSEPLSGGDGAHDYWPAIEQELARLDLNARCNTTSSTCIYTKTLPDNGPSFDIAIKYSRKTDSVYIYVDRFLTIPDPEGPSLELSRRLLALNREMVTAKLEWDKGASLIRLSTFINTDSNFDRRAFRSQLLSLWKVVEKIWPELKDCGR